MFDWVGFSSLSLALSRKWEDRFFLVFALVFHFVSDRTDCHQRFWDRRQIDCRTLQLWGLHSSKNTREVVRKIVNSSWQCLQFTSHTTFQICRIHKGFIINTVCVCPLVISRESNTAPTLVRLLFLCMIRWRGSSVIVPWPSWVSINLTVLAVQEIVWPKRVSHHWLRNVHLTTQQSSVLAAPVSSSPFSSASSLVHRRLSADLCHCPEESYTLHKPGDVVSDAFSSFPLELVRGREHLDTFTLLLWSLLSKLYFKSDYQGFNALAVSVSLTFQVVSDVFALWAAPPDRSSPDQLVVLLRVLQQVALQLTNWIRGSRLSCTVEPPAGTGIAVSLRKTHPLWLGFHTFKSVIDKDVLLRFFRNLLNVCRFAPGLAE